MCGIFCYVGSSLKPIDLQENFSRIEDRGPDYSILQSVDDVVLGFHRLAINDLSESGHQPFIYDEIYLICNGEIYNHKTLQEKYNIQTKSDSDCEVVLHMYKMFGFEETCKQLDGVFSLIIYNSKTKKLFVGRDPYGVRPLFIGYNEFEELFLSSEMKCIYDETIYCKQFKPGYALEIDLTNGNKIFRNYYDFIYKIDRIRDYDFILAGIKNKLISAVKKRLLSDRPIGALLSGGLDSSLIAGIISRIYKENNIKSKLTTFGIGIQGATDLEYSQKVADFIDSQHHQIVCTEEDFLNAIPDVIYSIESYDTTTVRASVGNYLVGNYIKKNTDITVVFNGDGSDEQSGYYYLRNAPNEDDFHGECMKLLREIHYFDVLRSDRSVSSQWSLEARTPFLDKEFVKFYMTIDPKLKMYSDDRIEKYLLRKAFEDTNIIPNDVLWRPKEAFSDGCSSEKRSWHKIIQEYVDTIITDEEFILNKDKYYHNPPQTKESYWYRKLFEEFYPNKSNVIPHFWLPNWSSEVDPSARELKRK